MNDKDLRINRRNNAIWYMYVEVGYAMSEIADIYKISKTMVHKIINSQAQKRADQLKNV